MEKDKKTKATNELIYNLYKDESIRSETFKYEISRKYKLTPKEISNIYIKIVNYQIKKYGGRLEKGTSIELLTREECKRRAGVLKAIKYYRSKRREK